MTLDEVEQKLVALLEAERDLIVRPEDHAEMLSLTKAGEPGVALEYLCTHLEEFQVAVPPAALAAIKELGMAMGIAEDYWTRLKESA
jgi:hypothetical protein